MKKGLLSFGIGIVVVFSVFFIWQNATPHSVSSSDLPKKEFAKEPIELPTEVASTSSTSRTSNTLNLVENSDEKVRTFTTVRHPDPNQPTKGDFLQVADRFIDEIVQPTDNQYEVKNFKTKQELINHLSLYASPDIAKYYVDGLYGERNGRLYIIPTELPPWIIMGEPSDLSQDSAHTYTLTQTNETDLYGKYKVKVTFNQQDGKWKIDDVEYTYD